MGVDPGLVPTLPATGSEYQRWSTVFAGDEYYYGSEPGPLSRRAVRYHRQYRLRGGSALDAGCGEGQDLAFLAARGYVATGVEFTENGIAKAERLLRSRGLEAELLLEDLRLYTPSRRYDLVLAVNSLPFLGADGEECLRRLITAAAPGGVFGLSLFARPERHAAAEPVRSGDSATTATLSEAADGFWMLTMEELLARFAGWQMLEAARLWQWNPYTHQPQPFLTFIARNVPASAPVLPLP
jgi:SAM-dependent methyltransferase